MKVLYYAGLGVICLLFVGTLVLAGDKCGEQILIAIGSLAVSAICVCLREASRARKNASHGYHRKTGAGDSTGKN